MGIAEIIALTSLVLTALLFPAMWAVHKTRTQAIISEEKPGIVSAAHQEAIKHVELVIDREVKARKAAIEEERDRAREMFAAKHEMSEMRGLVNQLVQNTSKLDEKLDRMHELLLQLAKTR